MNAADQQQFDAETRQEEYEVAQSALPTHKRSGYAERMAEQADILRKEKKENGE